MPPTVGFIHPVVFGNELGKFKKDLIAKYPNACDSIKSPLKPYLSILSKTKLFLLFRLSLIQSIKAIFFLPPPEIKYLILLSVPIFSIPLAIR